MFKVIEDYEEAAALGKCGLLWFRFDDTWVPSARKARNWDRLHDPMGQYAVAAGEYAILLED